MVAALKGKIMKNYIATFYSHYDAMVFAKFLKTQGTEAKLMPTPRRVSSSCGTCVAFGTDGSIDCEKHEIEALYEETPEGYKEL